MRISKSAVCAWLFLKESAYTTVNTQVTFSWSLRSQRCCCLPISIFCRRIPCYYPQLHPAPTGNQQSSSRNPYCPIHPPGFSSGLLRNRHPFFNYLKRILSFVRSLIFVPWKMNIDGKKALNHAFGFGASRPILLLAFFRAESIRSFASHLPFNNLWTVVRHFRYDRESLPSQKMPAHFSGLAL